MTIPRRLWECGIVLVIAAVYLSHLAPGHNFGDDDFGAYVMHAANLVEGRPYTAIHYIPNPETLWLVVPPEGYPPVYPSLLAPVYRIWGLNLRPLKVMTVLCFAGFLLVFSEFLRPYLSPLLSSCALLVVGFNPAFWGHRNALLAEFPYLLFSFAALLAIQRAYRNLSADQWRIGTAALVGLLVYLAYGTRIVGIVLLPALVLADLIKFRKPSRFLMSALVVAIGLITLQNLLIFAPAGYSGALQHSVRMGLGNALFYAKTLSYAWQNGFSKKVQIIFALLFTALAAMSFVRSLWTRRSATEFYLLGYVAVLLLWRAEIGMRGLLPILPLYFAFGLESFGWIVNRYEQMTRIACVSLLLLFVGASYGNEIHKESQQPPEPNIQDPAAQELFFFLARQYTAIRCLGFSKTTGFGAYDEPHGGDARARRASGRVRSFYREH